MVFLLLYFNVQNYAYSDPIVRFNQVAQSTTPYLVFRGKMLAGY